MKPTFGAGHPELRSLACLAALVGAPALVRAQVGGDGFDWAVVGAPGNRGTIPEETPQNPFGSPIGAVSHEFRMTRTEVTVGRWFEFVQAYAPYYTGSRLDSGFTSSWIRPDTLDPNLPPTYHMFAGSENFPANMSWRMAARYCNWLQNGKGLGQSAFESGAYDSSTFGSNPDGTMTDQAEHNPGAKYWIPTLDEWTKAFYYDPNRYGPGLEGYWQYQNGGNVPLISGPPGSGAETNAGTWPGDNGRFYDVGLYPDTQSPWGLLDGSGGVSEWTETIRHDSSRIFRGSERYSLFPAWEDNIAEALAASPGSDYPGFRLATVIPAPGSLVVAMCAVLARTPRRRRS